MVNFLSTLKKILKFFLLHISEQKPCQVCKMIFFYLLKMIFTHCFFFKTLISKNLYECHLFNFFFDSKPNKILSGLKKIEDSFTTFSQIFLTL